MPRRWQCPACKTRITHHAHEDAPRANVAYRCHVCKIDLTLDEKTNRLAVAPLTDRQRPPPGRPNG